MAELYERWVRDHHAAVWRTAWRLTRNAADAHDVTQEVFLQVLRRGEELAHEDSPQRLLRWLAAKTALAHLRGARNRRRREELHAMGRPEPESPQPAEERERAAAVRRCLAELPEELRLATVLRFDEELTFAQVGACLGVAEPTAFERVKRALATLRTRLAQLGHAGAATELERWLRVEEPLAAPAGLAASLLALAGAGAGGGVLAGTAAATAGAGALAKPGWIAGAIVAAVLAGGGWLVRSAATHEAPLAPALVAALATPDAAQDAAPVPAARRTEAPAQEEPARAPEAAGGRTLGEFVRGSFSLGPPMLSPDEAARRVATGRLAGQVVDEAGAALRGAQVRASSWEHARKGEVFTAAAECDAAGRFELELAVVQPELGQRYALTIEHPDVLPHRSEAHRVDAGATADAGRLALRRITSERLGDYQLEVRLRDADGHPVEGAWVRVYRQALAQREAAPDGEAAARARFETQAAWEGGAKSDATGTARTKGSRIGPKWIVVEAQGVGLPDHRVACEVRYTGMNELEVELPRGLSIRGRIVVPPDVNLEHESVGYVARWPAPTGPAQRSADDDGQGEHYLHVPGCSVIARSGDGLEQCHARLQADGSFEIAGLRGGSYRVEYHGSLAPAARFDVPAGARDVELVLKHAYDPRSVGHHLAELHGRVVDAETGEPVACRFDVVEWPEGDAERAQRRATMLAPPMPVQTAMAMRPMPQVDGVAPALFGDPAGGDPWGREEPPGTIHAPGLAAGEWCVVARAAGYAPGIAGPFQLEARTIVADVVVRLRRPGIVRGRLVDDGGRALRDATLVAIVADGDVAARLAALDRELRTSAYRRLFGVDCAVSERDGRFELELVPDVDYALGVLRRGSDPVALARITVGEREVRALGDCAIE